MQCFECNANRAEQLLNAGAIFGGDGPLLGHCAGWLPLHTPTARSLRGRRAPARVLARCEARGHGASGIANDTDSRHG